MHWPAKLQQPSRLHGLCRNRPQTCRHLSPTPLARATSGYLRVTSTRLHVASPLPPHLPVLTSAAEASVCQSSVVICKKGRCVALRHGLRLCNRKAKGWAGIQVLLPSIRLHARDVADALCKEVRDNLRLTLADSEQIRHQLPGFHLL